MAERIAKEFKIEGKSEAELLKYNIFQSKKVMELTLYPIVQVGNINAYRWMKMQEIMVKLGLTSGKPDFNEFIFNYEKIVNERQSLVEKGIIISMLVAFEIFIMFLLIHLSSKNRMLSLEIAERHRSKRKTSGKKLCLYIRHDLLQWSR